MDYKSWSLADIKKVFKEISQKMNMDCTNITIDISGRMTRCRGRYTYKRIDLTPIKFTFAKNLLDGSYNYETVKQVIIHEYCHFYTDSKYNYACGHDSRFKMICRKAGISDNTYFNIIKDIEILEMIVEIPKVAEVKVVEIIKEIIPTEVIEAQEITPQMVQEQAKFELLILKGKTNKMIIELSLKAYGIDYKYNGENIKTYGQWKSAGYQVQKGEKALLGCELWTPCHFSQSACEDKKNGTENDKKEYTKLYLKKSSLFSLEQVKLI